MKKKFCLALLLIAALCLSAGAEEANPQWLEGTWRMGNGTGTLVIEDPASEEAVTATGGMRVTISDVDENEGTLSMSGTGRYKFAIAGGEPSEPEDITIPKNDYPYEFNDGENTYEIEIDEEDDFTLTIKLLTETTAKVKIERAVTDEGDGDGEGTTGTMTLEFNASKVTDSSSSGGCDTGAGFGLFLALGALAVFKRAKRKA